jgi:sec-independent protein translocase protein TatB
MFDMGFTELMLIGIVALVVIGPERLPGVARTAGKYVGRLKRFMTTVKADVEQELRADELRQILSDQQSELDSLKESITEAGRGVEQEIGLQDVISTEATPEMTAAAPDVNQETPLPDPVSAKGVAKAAAKKSAAKDSASKKAASKKAASKKAASKKAASKKAAVKKPAVKKAAAKKSTTSSSPVKKATVKKAIAKKATAKKATARKTTPTKTTSDSAT